MGLLIIILLYWSRGLDPSTLLAVQCRKSSNSGLGRAQRRTTTGERQIIPIPTICVMRDAVLRLDYDMDLLTAHIQFMTKTVLTVS